MKSNLREDTDGPLSFDVDGSHSSTEASSAHCGTSLPQFLRPAFLLAHGAGGAALVGSSITRADRIICRGHQTPPMEKLQISKTGTGREHEEEELEIFLIGSVSLSLTPSVAHMDKAAGAKAEPYHPVTSKQYPMS